MAAADRVIDRRVLGEEQPGPFLVEPPGMTDPFVEFPGKAVDQLNDLRMIDQLPRPLT
jgi:hypothetical protein